MTKRIAPLLLIILLSACASPQAETAEVTKPMMRVSPDPSATGLNRLTFQVALKDTSVASGERATLEITVRNETDEPITDPGCYLAQTSAAIIPEGEPDAELWLQVITDCQGPSKMDPGDQEAWETILYARTKSGEGLEAGRYIAALEMRGVDHRFELPIEVTE
ncbi:MAG: hypothetical protein M3345_00470 [Actinomycetota bacterium]|nr:hypothetical protein [Actinomycetota bacterium]